MSSDEELLKKLVVIMCDIINETGAPTVFLQDILPRIKLDEKTVIEICRFGVERGALRAKTSNRISLGELYKQYL